MPMYFVETTHEPSEQACMRSLDAAVAQGSHFLSNVLWGCDDGVHKTWIFLEAASRDEARRMIPPMDRLLSTIVEVRKFTPAEVRAKHASSGL